MGLDMYLFDKSKSDDQFESIGYWRKANQIHNFFVENVQFGNDDCGEYEVTKSDLISLQRLCFDVLMKEDKPENLLPTIDGFFFGSVEYDDYYYDQLRDTLKICDKAIAYLDSDEGNTLTYTSSW